MTFSQQLDRMNELLGEATAMAKDMREYWESVPHHLEDVEHEEEMHQEQMKVIEKQYNYEHEEDFANQPWRLEYSKKQNQFHLCLDSERFAWSSDWKIIGVYDNLRLAQEKSDTLRLDLGELNTTKSYPPTPR